MSNRNLARLTSRSVAAASVFGALGEPTRLSLVVKLSDGSRRSIAQLTEGKALTRQAISKHLRVLQDADVVVSERSGRESLFALNRASLQDIQAYVELLSQRWDESLARLQAFVEK